MDQGYGDNVTATTMGGFHYDIGAEGATENVAVSYGTLDPALWNTGYGDLVNVLFEDADGSGVLTVTLTAEAGYNVSLLSFELAAYTSSFGSDPTIDLVEISGSSHGVFYSFEDEGVEWLSHNIYAFSDVIDQSITITVDARNLGTLNDDIAIDNIKFQQTEVVPEPATLAALGIGALGAIRRRRK